MSIKSQRLGSLLTAAFLAVSLQAASAFSTEGGNVWPNATATIDYVIPGTDQSWTAALQTAMSDWNSVSSFTFVGVNQSADPCATDGANGVAFATDACGQAFGSTTLALTFYRYSNGALVHAGTVFNQNQPFSIYSGPQSSRYDFRRVAVHELGHVLGLGHETDSSISAVMAPVAGNIELPTADDIAGVQSLYGVPATLVSAVLPASRSIKANATATIFATIINTGTKDGTGCSITSTGQVQAALSYQTTDPATNRPIGEANQPVNIAAGGSQSFVISMTPSSTFDATNVAFTMNCANISLAPSVVGLNTLLFSSSNVPVPDMIALATTATNDGYVHLPSTTSPGAFAIAAANLGISATIVASADTGTTTLPVTVTLCQTDPSTGACVTPVGASVTTVVNANATPTFSVFVKASASIPADPANKRIFVRFKDAKGITRGSTSVAVTSP